MYPPKPILPSRTSKVDLTDSGTAGSILPKSTRFPAGVFPFLFAAFLFGGGIYLNAQESAAPEDGSAIFLLGCSEGALHQYFQPAHWQMEYPSGPFRATFRVDDQGIGTITLPAGARLRLSISIPAEGELMIDWKQPGSTPLEVHSFHSEGSEQWEGQEGTLFSGTLSRGATFGLEVANTGTVPATLRLDHFQFFTPVRKVKVHFNRQGRPLRVQVLNETPDFSRILFPADQIVFHPDDLQPESCGGPFIDADGHAASKDDQQLLHDGRFGWTVSYRDVRESLPGMERILREWEVFDPCTGNRIRHQQEILLPNADPADVETLGKNHP